MAIGDIISSTDYNTIRAKIINVMSTGIGNTGYGQTTFSSDVLAGNIVTKEQWDGLRYDIYNAIIHQTGSTPSIVSVAAGDVIRYGASNPNTQYDTLADQAATNRFNLGTGQFVTEVLATQTRSGSWNSSLTATATVTFSTAEQARFFFNSGGKIRFTSTRTGGVSSQQNTEWSNLLTTIGTQAFAANSPTVNFFNLTNSYRTFFTQSNSSPYAQNSWRLEAQCNVANNSSGTANIINFRITWIDNYTDSGPETPPDDYVDGTMTLTMDSVRAFGVLQPTNTAGSFAITAPATGTISTITGG